MKQKKAVSGVVVMVVMIALVISISAIVFTLTKKTVEEKIKKSEACEPDIIGKLSINYEYVCYDSAKKEIVFSINRKDIDLDKLIIAIETETEVKQFELKENEPNGELIPFNLQDTATLPKKNGGRTYIATGFSEPVIGIKIIPVINEEQCEVADSLNEITDCELTGIFS
ncbi:hypothetical protein HYS72_02915 [Candidatus Pacearchaeota archaeon]|nr:hypothetical protein [Candidatus Pacearchaeota archaeon]MBI2056838.1 hypothetical protein [Candidatus Pacearchaeota archaeon]